MTTEDDIAEGQEDAQDGPANADMERAIEALVSQLQKQKVRWSQPEWRVVLESLVGFSRLTRPRRQRLIDRLEIAGIYNPALKVDFTSVLKLIIGFAPLFK